MARSKYLGFSGPQTRFIVTVALHSGFCLRRQYATFAKLEYGAGMRHFLDRLVRQKLARRFDFQPDRGHVYHLHARAINDAIGQDDNRNRRHTSPALIARKLMLLDYVLGEPESDWYATEEGKVALFATRFGIASANLPQRVYLSRRAGTPDTVRYFIHKLPVSLSGEPPVPSFVFLAVDNTGEAFSQFLQDHRQLLSHLPAWRLVVVAPMHIPGPPACTAALRRFCGALQTPRAAEEVAQLQTYFTRRACVERDDLSFTAENSNGIITEWHEARRRYAAPEYQELYERWSAYGPSVLQDRGGEAFLRAVGDGRGKLVTHQLPLRYDRFGSRAGVC